jgi:hypothetical protein
MKSKEDAINKGAKILKHFKKNMDKCRYNAEQKLKHILCSQVLNSCKVSKI